MDMKDGAPTLPMAKKFPLVLSPWVTYPLAFNVRCENLLTSPVVSNIHYRDTIDFEWISSIPTKQKKLFLVRYPSCLGSFIVSSFLNPYIVSTCHTKVSNIASIRCMAKNTTTKTICNKVDLVSWNLFFLYNPFLFLLMNMLNLHIVGFLGFRLITSLYKNDFVGT